MLRERDPPARAPSGPSSRWQPFPWGWLDTLARHEAETLRDVRRWTAAQVRPAAVSEALRHLTSARFDMRLRGVQPAGDARPLQDAIGVLVVPAGARSADGGLVEVEGALAAAIAARVLRRPPPVLIKPLRPSQDIAGALAAVVAAAARRAHAGTALEVRAAGPAPELEAALYEHDPSAIAVTVTILLGDDAYAGRLVISRRTLANRSATPTAPWSALALSGLGATPLAVPVVACAVESTVSDVAALGPGDVLVPGSWPTALDATPEGMAGPVLLSPPSGTAGVRAELVDGGRLVLRGETEPLCAAEATMQDAGRESALVSAIGEVPVLVRVELGEAVMSARDWASLSPGDVVGLGRRVGDHVLLRVGSVLVARGELVDLEGEVGVRIVARLTEETTSP